MIIKPQFVDRNVREYKYLSTKNTNTRFDSVYIDNEKVIKSTHFGTNNNFYDFIWTETDIKSGEIINIKSSIRDKGPHFNNELPSNYIYPSYSNYAIGKSNVVDNSYFQYQIDCYEDDFNLSFTDTVGPLIALLSSSTISIPFRMAIIMDSKMGIMIHNYYDTFKDIDSSGISDTIVTNFMRSLNVIDKRFRHICENEKRNIRILAYIGDFGISIRIIDVDYNITLLYELNNSDHCRILRIIDAYVGSKYVSSEPFGSLYDAKCIALMPTLFDSYIDQNNFLYKNEGKNYETVYWGV